MNLLKNLRQELEATKLQPISVEISNDQLIRISVAVIIMAAFIFLMNGLISSIVK